MMEFEESGMIFAFPETDCFRIEEDEIVISRSHIKACECVATLHDDARALVLFIEAKSSAPREKNPDMSLASYGGEPFDKRWSIRTDFDNFVNDICQKFQDSYSLCSAMAAGHHGKKAHDRLPAVCLPLHHDKIRFTLIINGFKEEWCAPLNDAIKKHMRHFLNAWNISDTSVRTFNCQGAADAGIPVVSASSPRRAAPTPTPPAP